MGVANRQHGQLAVQLVLQDAEEMFPTWIVEITQDALPLLVGIVVKAPFVGTFAWPPSGNLYAGIPFVEVALFLVRSQTSSLVCPTSDTEL